MGLLMSGPIAHILVIMARGADIDFDLGVENPEKTPSLEYFRALSRENPDIVDAMNKVLDPTAGEDDTDESASPDQEGNPNAPQDTGPTPPEDVATQAPSTGLGGMTPPSPAGQAPQPAPENPSAGAPNDPTQGVM